MDIRLPNNWLPRWYQEPAWMAWEQGCKREILFWHRRAGKDDVQLHKTCLAAHLRVGVYWHALPEYEQARKSVWEAVNPRTQKRRIDEAFPPALRKRTDSVGMVIEFLNGSLWRLVGSDDPSSLVGAPPIGITFSEWALSNPETWAYLSPILLENGGWASFISTPRGKNHAYNMLLTATKDAFDPLRNPNGWFSQVLTVNDTNFPLELVEHQRQEFRGIYGDDAGDALVDQEYFCSFEAAVLGSYYGKLITDAERSGRIGIVSYDPALPLHVVWDIGKGMNLAVIAFQVHLDECRIIKGIKGAHDEMIPDMIDRLKEWGTTIGVEEWGDDWVPHDAKVLEHNKKTRIQLMIDLKRKTRLVPAHKIEDGINAGRVTFPKTRWDRAGTAETLEHLRQYQAEWDPDRRIFKETPLHNWTSHFADAYRYLSIAWREIRADPLPKPPGRTIHQMTLEELWKMHEGGLDRADRI